MNPSTIHIAKHLPSFVYKPLSKLYQKYNLKITWDDELIEDIMEFFNLDDYDETIRMLKSGYKQTYDLWNELNPQTEEEILRFYENVNFVFDLASWHMTRGYINFRNDILKYCSGDVLDYGGGIGDLCTKLAENGLHVTYGDVSGKTMGFAKWFFKKRGYENEIKVLNLENEFDLLGKYDTILCIDVIEHIPHKKIVLERMARHLRNNGRLIITKVNFQGEEGNPLHLKTVLDAEKLLKELGLVKGGYDWLWIKKSRQIIEDDER